MSNERIDLTEFEGMTEGPWLHTIPEHGWDDIVGANEMLVAQVTLENHVNGPSIARLPDLLAELKRCYEEIDDLKRQYQSCNEALVETTNWSVRMVEAIDSGKMSEIKRVRNS
jgi:hypothetical protein